ncbi:hypothetical protein MASR2M12_20790 [Bacteroidales bacterium]
MDNKVILISTLEEMTQAFEKIIQKIADNPARPTTRKMLTRQQAAKFTSMSYHTFGVHVRSGRFVERGIGRKKFFYEDELIQALNSKK